MRDHYVLQRYQFRTNPGSSDVGNLCAVNPIRRSLAVILTSVGMIAAPAALLRGEWQTIALIVATWFGVTGIALCTPILIWCLVEEAWGWCQRRLWPTVEQLDLSPRARNLLRRHGFVTIASVEQASDGALLLLSNMDARAVQEIRRSISLWRYRRWQENGFQ